MELGNQIKALRTRRGITQETLAAVLNVSPQAVSKWEREAALPDIQLLPALSAYFGVTIDELFALSDEMRLERIQNMLWDERELDPDRVERERTFLLDMARREPENEKPLVLLADMENQLAEEHQRRAAEYARESLKRNPRQKGGHVALIQAMKGAFTDWCAYNHHELIDWYKEFVERNPDYVSGYLWLMDQLMVDERMEEAAEYLERMAELDHTFRTPLYRGLVAWGKGEREDALAIWEEMCRIYPDEWCVWLWMGDLMARSGRYEEAKAHYRRSLETQKAPRYTDGTTSIAHVCEIQKDWAGAVAAHEEELAILAAEWDTTTGEQVDQHHREIARLKAQMG